MTSMKVRGGVAVWRDGTYYLVGFGATDPVQIEKAKNYRRDQLPLVAQAVEIEIAMPDEDIATISILPKNSGELASNSDT